MMMRIVRNTSALARLDLRGGARQMADIKFRVHDDFRAWTIYCFQVIPMFKLPIIIETRS